MEQDCSELNSWHNFAHKEHPNLIRTSESIIIQGGIALQHVGAPKRIGRPYLGGGSYVLTNSDAGLHLTFLAGSQNAFLVKSKSAGGFQFSRDPFNLINKHSRKHAGFVNDKAVSLQAGDKGGVHLRTKKGDSAHKPSSQHNSYALKSSSSNQK